MKVAHLITGLGMGGAEQQLKALVTDPDKSTLEHIVISMKDEGTIGKDLVGQPGVYVYSLNLHKSIFGFWKLYKILRNEKPDILQTWLYHADFLGLLIGKLARIRHIVWNIRCSNMKLKYYSWKTSFIVSMLRILSRFPDAIITNSHAGRIYHTQLGFKAKQWVRISNGIDTERFNPDIAAGRAMRRYLNIPEKAFVIGMIGRVDPMKDYSTFLTAVTKLSETHKDIYCIIAGTGTDQASWPIVPPHFLGLGMWEKVPELLNALDVMVLCSFGEGFPNVVGEAMACGVPTIVSNVGDVGLIVQTKAHVIPPQDVDQLIIVLDDLLSISPQQRYAIGQEGRERILASYSLAVMRKRYESFYKKLR